MIMMNDNDDVDDNDCDDVDDDDEYCEPGQRGLSSLPWLPHHAVSNIINWKKRNMKNHMNRNTIELNKIITPCPT